MTKHLTLFLVISKPLVINLLRGKNERATKQQSETSPGASHSWVGLRNHRISPNTPAIRSSGHRFRCSFLVQRQQPWPHSNNCKHRRSHPRNDHRCNGHE